MPQELVIAQLQPQYRLKVDASSVQLNFIGKSKLIFSHLKTLTVLSWVPQEIGQVYNCSIRDDDLTFEQRYVLTTIDHSNLTIFLEKQVKRYIFYEITYLAAKYQGQVQLTLKQMEEEQQIIAVAGDKYERAEQKSILIFRSNKQEVSCRLAALKKFQQQMVIYPLDDYLQNSKLKSQEYRPFVQGLIRHYHNIIKHYLRKQLQKFDLEQDLIITNILASYELQQLEKTRIKHGIALSIIAYERTLPKAYQILERWFEKANWIILEVDQIQCCPREQISQWFLEKRHIKAVIVSTGSPSSEKAQCERVVVFAPRMDKPHLERELCSTTRLITGLQFNVGGRGREGRYYEQDNRFHLVYKYKREFQRFMVGERGGQTNLNMKVYQEYILVSCDPLTESRVREQIKKFLQLYEEEQVPITDFSCSFHIAIFKHFYSSSIRTKPINLYVENNRLIRHNSKQMSEQAGTQISDIYKRMRRELVFKPLSKPLNIKKEYLSISTAPSDWMTAECLESRRYNVGDKLTIYVRSYGSRTNSDYDCIFLVEDFGKCHQLKEILQQEEVSMNFEEVLKKNRNIKRSLRYCRYFDNIIAWFLGKDRINKRGSSKYNRIQEELQSLFGNTHNQMSFKFMFPTDSEGLIQFLLPSLLETLLKSCNFERGVRKEVTFFTSCRQGPSLRRQLVDQLRRFSRQATINRVTDLDLQFEDIEKIIEYKYIQLKYYESQMTKCASALNSFIFSREVLKKGKTPIFLPSEDCKRHCEYLVSYFSDAVYEIKEGRIAKLRQKLGELNELNGLACLIKKYFPMLDYVVLYGRLDKGVFSHRMLYTESREDMYQQLLELELDIDQQKILRKQKGQRIRYKIISNEFLQLYRVQTHPGALAELDNLKHCVML